MSEVYDEAGLAQLERQIDEWLGRLHHEIPQLAAIDRAEEELIRWYVRLEGDEKDYTTVWLTLGQRTLRFETYVMPAPEENATELYEQLLRRNNALVGVHFSIGEEDAVFLRGELPVELVSERELDRVIGTVFATVEMSFRSLLRIGFASRFGG